MSHRPVKISLWVRFLESKGCKYVSTKASHDKYKCPGCTRSIIHRENDKDIPALHIHTNLKSMGVDKNEFWKWIEDNS